MAADVNPSTWMHDLAPYIQGRKLSEIVIPGSHDSATYSLPAPDDDLWHTQSDDLIHQLNDGMREFDIRVECFPDGDCFAHHGTAGSLLDGVSNWLNLSRIFLDIRTWAQEPGHSQEIIVIDLSIAQRDSDIHYWPWGDCANFGDDHMGMGDALVTPNQLQAAFGTRDPGQVTLGDLWSLPDSNGSARVILGQSECLDHARPGGIGAGIWTPNPPFGSFYADQCTADGIGSITSDQDTGIQSLVLAAAKTRASGTGSRPNGLGPPVTGGLYTLFVQGTPEDGCLYTPTNMIGDERQVLAALYQQWQIDPATKANLNIVSGDFVQETDLYKDVIAMDESFTDTEFEPTITSSDNAQFTAGSPASITVTATGSPTPTISSGSVPAGMELRDNGNGTATLSGTPNPPGTYKFDIAAANQAGAAGQEFTMLVTPAGSPFTSPDHVTFTYGEPGTFTMTTDHDHGELIWSDCSIDPTGLTFTPDNSNGTATITWTPTVSGDFTLCEQVGQAGGKGLWTQKLKITVPVPS